MTPEIWLEARERWRNISLFGALVAKKYFSGDIPIDMDLTLGASRL